MTFKRCLLVLLLSLAALPLVAWSVAKPMRLLAPELNGVSCSESVCVDDATRMGEAKDLYGSAHGYVSDRLTQLTGRPLMVFCSTTACYQSFGGGAERAITYPKLGSLIAPTSWEPHFARHELIHALQAQELGAMRMMREPAWFREGMAYSVSDPPGHDMPPQFAVYRMRYESWVADFSTSELWAAPRKL